MSQSVLVICFTRLQNTTEVDATWSLLQDPVVAT